MSALPSDHSIWSARGKRVVDAPHQARARSWPGTATGRVDLPGEVGVAGDLPARQVDRLQAGLGHLDGLAAGHGAECVDVVLGVEQVPQPLGAASGEGVLDGERSLEPDDVLSASSRAVTPSSTGGSISQSLRLACCCVP